MSIELIFGSKEEGKSTYMLDQIKRSLRPCIAIDTILWTDVKTKKLVFDQHMIRIDKPKDFSRWDRFKVVYTPDSELDMTTFCVHLFLYYSINIYIDELDFWCHKNYLPPELYNIFRYSAHRDFNIYATMRDPTEIHRHIRALSDYFVIFRLKEKRYLEYFKFYSESLPDEISKLGKHQKIKYALY